MCVCVCVCVCGGGGGAEQLSLNRPKVLPPLFKNLGGGGLHASSVSLTILIRPPSLKI